MQNSPQQFKSCHWLHCFYGSVQIPNFIFGCVAKSKLLTDSVVHHSFGLCMRERVLACVCSAHSRWQCSAHLDWSVCVLYSAYLLRLQRRVWHDRVPAYLSVLLALLSSPLGSVSRGWSHIDTQHICFCSFLHLKRMTALCCKNKNKKIYNSSSAFYLDIIALVHFQIKMSL